MKIENCMYREVCDDECSTICKRYGVTKFMLQNSNIPQTKWGINPLTPEKCDIKAFEQLADIRNNIVDFVKSGKNLYLYSPICRNGKTTWSIKLMLQYFNDVWEGNGFRERGVFMPVSEFLYKCKSEISNPTNEFTKLKNDILNVDLVIWDDIACSKMSDYDYNMLLAFIDHRVVQEKSNIFNGNIPPQKLDEYVGKKLASRINGSVKIELKGGDNRW